MDSSLSNSQILEELRQMDWDEFEALVAEHWEERGWNARVTSGSQDRGIDIEATNHNHAKSKLLIQAKRHQQGNKVSAPKIREYASLYLQENNVNTVCVVTTSSFTQQAKEIADDMQVKLINGQKLVRQLSDQLITEWFGDTANSTANNNSKRTQSRKSEIRISDSDANSLSPHNTGSDSGYDDTPEYIVTPGYIVWTAMILCCFCLIGGSLWVMDSVNFIPDNIFAFPIVFIFLMYIILLFLAGIKRVAPSVVTNVLSRGA